MSAEDSAAGVTEDDADAAAAAGSVSQSGWEAGRFCVRLQSGKTLYGKNLIIACGGPCRTENREHRRRLRFCPGFRTYSDAAPSRADRGGVRRGVSRGAEGRPGQRTCAALGTVRRKNSGGAGRNPVYGNRNLGDLCL